MFARFHFKLRWYENRSILSFQGLTASFAIQQGDFCTTWPFRPKGPFWLLCCIPGLGHELQSALCLTFFVLSASDHVVRVAFRQGYVTQIHWPKRPGKTLYSDKERFGPYKAIPNPKSLKSKKPVNIWNPKATIFELSKITLHGSDQVQVVRVGRDSWLSYVKHCLGICI